MDYEEVLAHYSRPQVKSELSTYCRGKWIALEGSRRDGGRLFLRYERRPRKPLTIDTSEDLDETLKRFRYSRPRTVYASVNAYRKLEDPEDLEEPTNIVGCTPIWDVDASLDSWEYSLEVADAIVSFLDKEGVSRSLFLKWSGRGVHIHIHEGAFSRNLLKRRNPLDISFSIVEYVLKKTESQLADLMAKAPQSSDRPLKVENKIDLKRVFTAPLSLHRSLDLCCVCFKPSDLYNFSLDWAQPDGYRHDDGWKAFEEGEADPLAEKSLAKIGGYDGWPKPTRRAKVRRETVKAIAPERRLGRFQVMALLQAVRYFLITGDMERAKSFGLNRAIFYAWAKRRGRTRPSRTGMRVGTPEARVEERRAEQLGNEKAFVSPRGWFIMGDDEQTPADYDRQIARRIEAAATPYEDAWVTAIEYLKGFPRETLLDQQGFYRDAYRTVRDTFQTLIERRRQAGS